MYLVNNQVMKYERNNLNITDIPKIQANLKRLGVKLSDNELINLIQQSSDTNIYFDAGQFHNPNKNYTRKEPSTSHNLKVFNKGHFDGFVDGLHEGHRYGYHDGIEKILDNQEEIPIYKQKRRNYQPNDNEEMNEISLKKKVNKNFEPNIQHNQIPQSLINKKDQRYDGYKTQNYKLNDPNKVNLFGHQVNWNKPTSLPNGFLKKH